MASADFSKELDCSICLHTYTDPVMLRCGHNFCRVCIDRALSTQDESGVYTCPQCRAHFYKRPSLQRNITLCNIIQQFLSIPTPQKGTGIFCTNCIHSPVPAVKSCLHCEVSLCDNHLRVHSKSPEHVLTEPCTSLEKRKCSVHKKILEYYCTEDATCICVTCSLVGEHQGHWVEMLDEASEKKKKKVTHILQKLTRKREETETGVQNLEKRWRKAQEKATGDAQKVTALFTDTRRRLDNLEKKVLSEISRQEEQVSLMLSTLIQELEIKKDVLSRKMRHIEELCNMTDPLTVLQEPHIDDLCDPEMEGGDDTGRDDKQLYDVADTEDLPVSTKKNVKVRTAGGNVTDPGNCGNYMEGPGDILLDVNTAANNILISDDLKTATWSQTEQDRPDTAERFQDYNQVLSSRTFFSGRHYWDVESSGKAEWLVGMCYPSIDRKGDQSYIGDNDKSWCLQRENNYLVMHDSQAIQLPVKISSDKVRICLDYEAGQLSFYELCDPIRHLHTFNATFTEPLHAVLCLGNGSIKISGWGSNCEEL
ncbi:E3 ubiquitin-protein ligase TRIM11-like [Bufo gargarizans]|uniref:E3 ubiquitin-protein ligase TRIM11-like n=1 Tax=Bufo gargarizans TaxID=30331 RepID=UPI001CF19E55|nr:E3 ubiquitin-protein ligase TRIM11-like [Bufo gargarizans]